MKYSIKFKGKKISNLSKEDAKNWTAWLQSIGVQYKLKS